MSAYLFIWNPTLWRWESLPQAVSDTNSGHGFVEPWSCGVTRRIAVGDRAFLMRLGVAPKGIVGSGVVTSRPTEDEHWDPERAKKGDTAFYVDIEFDVLRTEPVIPEADLMAGPLSEHDWWPNASGTSIPPAIASLLEQEWKARTGTEPPRNVPQPTTATEGAPKARRSTVYERSSINRDRCIQIHGTTCAVCGMSFGKQYGSLGEGFIHVHHIRPLGEVGTAHEVDPEKDLRPVCPNCHAMIHQRQPPFAIDEIKRMLSRAKRPYASSPSG